MSEEPHRQPPGRDPEVAFPLAIASAALGVVGLTIPLLAWVAMLLAVTGYLMGVRHAPTRAFALGGAAFALVGIVAAILGGQ